MNVDRLMELADKARFLTTNKPQNRDNDWFSIKNQDNDRAEVFIYGVIGSDWEVGDVTAATFVNELNKITASSIDLHINSPGGLVYDGVAIYSALLNHSATVNVFVDGVAASAASFVAMAGDTRTIEKPARMFIHDAHGLAIGNAELMRETANVLDDLSNTIAEIYSDRAGGSAETWRELMRNETWFSSEQALQSGLADKIANDKPKATPNDMASQIIRAKMRVRGK